jgi:hypothetical protein
MSGLTSKRLRLANRTKPQSFCFLNALSVGSVISVVKKMTHGEKNDSR